MTEPLVLLSPESEMMSLHCCYHPCWLRLKACCLLSFFCLLLASQAEVVEGFLKALRQMHRHFAVEEARPSRWDSCCQVHRHHYHHTAERPVATNGKKFVIEL